MAKLSNWLAEATSEWGEVMQGEGSVRFKTQPLVMGQEFMVPSARGTVWDLRTSGVATPLSQAPRSRDPILNTGKFWEWAHEHPEFPDQEIFEELEHGWRGYTDATPLVTVLQLPNKSFLKYFTEGAATIEEDVLTNLALRIDHIPFWPIRLIPMGTAAKPRSVKRRITSDLSAPWDPIIVKYNNQGQLLQDPTPIQLASNFYTSDETLSGVKLPTDTDISLAGSLLATAGTKLSALKFDEKGAYKQTLVHTSELWKSCVFWEGRFIVPLVLGFGSSWGPDCYNRLARLKHAIFLSILTTDLGVRDPTQSPIPSISSRCLSLFRDPRIVRWITTRAALFPLSPEQWLPLWLAIYLDDSCFVALDERVASWIQRLFFKFAADYWIALSMDKWQEEGAPASKKIFLGVMYDWLTGMKSITPEKRDFSIS